jgi:hypothetical protein
VVHGPLVFRGDSLRGCPDAGLLVPPKTSSSKSVPLDLKESLV